MTVKRRDGAPAAMTSSLRPTDVICTRTTTTTTTTTTTSTWRHVVIATQSVRPMLTWMMSDTDVGLWCLLVLVMTSSADCVKLARFRRWRRQLGLMHEYQTQPICVVSHIASRHDSWPITALHPCKAHVKINRKSKIDPSVKWQPMKISM